MSQQVIALILTILIIIILGFFLFRKIKQESIKMREENELDNNHLSDNQVDNAKIYYKQNREQVNESIEDSFLPSRPIEKDLPNMWSPNEWVWFKGIHIKYRLSGKTTGLEWLGIFDTEEDI